MKKWRKVKIQRAINELSKTVAGCVSATCPFRSEDDAGSVGTANICDCRQRSVELVAQLAGDVLK